MADPPTRDGIVIEDGLLAAGFTQVPNLILRSPDLTHGAKIAYALLLSYAWQDDHCFPGQDRMATDMGVERKAVIRYLKELKDFGLVRVQRRGLGLTNVYFLPRIADVPKKGHLEVSLIGLVEVPPVGLKEDAVKKTQNGKDPSSTRKASRLDYDKSREELHGLVADFSREFRDTASVTASLTRVVGIYRNSGLPLDGFVERMYQARQTTKERTDSVRAGEGGKKRLFPYWIAVLEDLCGVGLDVGAEV